MTEVSPALYYREIFRVTGPLLSLVFRTEDVWQRYNQYRIPYNFWQFLIMSVGLIFGLWSVYFAVT